MIVRAGNDVEVMKIRAFENMSRLFVEGNEKEQLELIHELMDNLSLLEEIIVEGDF